MQMSLVMIVIAASAVVLITSIVYIFITPENNSNSLVQINKSRLLNKKAIEWQENHHLWPETGFVDSPFGKTHYYFLGPKNGKRLVFVVGILAPAPTIPEFLHQLADKGYRVLTYDLYGRGFSDAPIATYDDALYTCQLHYLVTKLSFTRFHLVGHSLGGAICTSFASQFPHLIESCCLIQPAGLMRKLPLTVSLVKIPIIGHIIFYSLARIILAFTESYRKPEFLSLTLYQLNHHPGILRAFYSTLLNFPFCTMDEQYQQLEVVLGQKTGVTLGEFDEIITMDIKSKLQMLLPSSVINILKEDHGILETNPKLSVDSIIQIHNRETRIIEQEMMIYILIIFWILIFLISYLYFKYVPAANVPLPSFKTLNNKRLKNKENVEWKDDYWEGSDYVDSPFGKTHYYLLGPKNGKRLVFVHGITAASPCFHEFIQGLADKGFRVLTYDLYGRGYSDSPGTYYNSALYTSQLYFLVTKLNWTKFHLAGLSLGGAISTAFATEFPEMIESLSLIAPAGLLNTLPLVSYALQTPFLGPIIWHSLGRKILLRLSESNYITTKKSIGVQRCIKMTAYHVAYHPGFLRAFYSTVQNFPLCGMDSVYRKLETFHPDRVGILWGKCDKVVPFELFDKFISLVPSSKRFTPDDEGHSICVENPGICIEMICIMAGI